VARPEVQRSRGFSGGPSLAWTLAPVCLAFLFYLPVLGDGFVNWDDPSFITDNPHIRSLRPDNLAWMFTTFYTGNWIPLAWLSLALDYALGGLTPWVYHLHSLFLHCANTLLVFLFARKFLSLPSVPQLPVEPAAFLTALLFGLHPLHVESVAWANEERDVLCAFFFLLSLLLYLETPDKPGWRNWPLRACLGSFLLALMAKPMAVTLPFVLVLLDAWPLKQLQARPHALREKAPFFLFSLAEAVVAPLAQGSAHALAANSVVPPAYRVMNAFHSVIFYLAKMALPTDLHPFYHFPRVGVILSASNIISALLVVILSTVFLALQRPLPWLGTAWLYFLLTLLPVLGLVQTGSQAAADRFTYLPSLGPFFLAGAGAARLLVNRRILFFGAAALLAAALGFLTLRQLAPWKDDLTFWESQVKARQDSPYIPTANLGRAYLDAGRYAEALEQFDRAVALEPAMANPHNGRGMALGYLGRLDEARDEFKKAAALDPLYPHPHFNLAALDERAGDWKGEELELEAGLAVDPGNAEALYDLGLCREKLGDRAGATESLRAVLSRDPSNPWVMLELGEVLLASGDKDGAMEILRQAAAHGPPSPEFRHRLSEVLAQAGDQSQPIEPTGRSDGSGINTAPALRKATP